MKKNLLILMSIFLATNLLADENVVVRDNGSIIGGKNTVITNEQNTSSAIALGRNTTLNKSGIIIGSYSKGSEGSIIIGNSSKIEKTSNEPSIVIGNESGTIKNKAIVIGRSAFSSGGYATAIGDSSYSNGGNNVALGDHAYAGAEATSIGAYTNAFGKNSSALGRRANSFGDESVAVGVDAKSFTKFSVAMGNASEAKGKSSMALGASSKANIEHATALGGYTKVDSFEGIALGYGSESNRDAYIQGYNPDEEDTKEYITGNAEAKIAEKKEQETKLKDFNNLVDKDILKKYTDYLNAKKDKEFKSIGASDSLITNLEKKEKEKSDAFKNAIKAKCAGKDFKICTLLDDEANNADKIVEEYKKEYEKVYDAYRKINVAVDQSGMVSRKGALSIGKESTKEYRQIIGVAAGTNDTDAVNVLQLKKLKEYSDRKFNKIEEDITEIKADVETLEGKVDTFGGKIDTLERKVDSIEQNIKRDLGATNSGIAAAMSMSSLNKISTSSNKKFAISTAMGTYNRAYAIAVGLSGATKNFTYNANFSLNSDKKVGFSAGLSYEFGQKQEQENDVKTIIEMNKKLMQENENLRKQIETILKKLK